ncbi:MAG: DUF386 domain-containing protein [Anaerolineaceae bacterium]|jgi:YhcH/YjgK/YiaL family protein|nr:MAG: DUF386 domain-containing protein [Anaerolineaceae bacterium]
MKKGSLGQDLKSFGTPEYITDALIEIKRINFPSLKGGKYPIENGKILIYSGYETKIPGEKILVEGHKKYIDVQFIIEGREAIGVLPSDHIHDKSAYDEINDVWTAEVASEELKFTELGAGDFLILFPDDAHAPQQAVEKIPMLVKKGVIKIPVR